MKTGKKAIHKLAMALMIAAAFALVTAIPNSPVNANMKLKKVHKDTKLNTCKSCHHKPGSKKCGVCHAGSAPMQNKLHTKCKSCHKQSQKAKIGGYLSASSKCKKCHK